MVTKKEKKDKIKGEVSKKVKEKVEELANIVAEGYAPPGTHLPQSEDNNTDDNQDIEVVVDEPDTNSVPPSHVTGETVIESINKSK